MTTRRNESFKLRVRNHRHKREIKKKKNSAELPMGRLLCCNAEYEIKNLKASCQRERIHARSQKPIIYHTQSL